MKVDPVPGPALQGLRHVLTPDPYNYSNQDYCSHFTDEKQIQRSSVALPKAT